MRYAALMAVLMLTTAPVQAQAQAQAPASLTLAPVWGDHGVIQRDRPILVEGWTAPRRAVSGDLGDAHATAASDASGHFALRFPRARPAMPG
jgi:sialate O-acetylesterase